ncbi:DUF2867 domain-containing protein [Nocardia sp. SC052]|uniref:DUF2867 domain-containing protein n=1 Tax=Nocardia sichangensis TaxID=3385975 RepID=UPI0039A19980
MHMRISKNAYLSSNWRIQEIASDFRVEDVWELPTPGGPDEFPRLVQEISSGGDSRQFSRSFRVLFTIRWAIGTLLGWDKPDTGIGVRVRSLRDRLPDDLRAGPRGPDLHGKPFRSVYLTEREWASELANRTVHTVMHIVWVPNGRGKYTGQMAVLVKPNGLFGRLYMIAILPFRYLGVYRSLISVIGRRWQHSEKERGASY